MCTNLHSNRRHYVRHVGGLGRCWVFLLSRIRVFFFSFWTLVAIFYQRYVSPLFFVVFFYRAKRPAFGHLWRWMTKEVHWCATNTIFIGFNNILYCRLNVNTASLSLFIYRFGRDLLAVAFKQRQFFFQLLFSCTLLAWKSLFVHERIDSDLLISLIFFVWM